MPFKAPPPPQNLNNSFEKYLQNPTFIHRYITQNISWHSSYLSGKRGFKRIFTLPYAAVMKKFFLKKYFERRVLKGVVDIPYLELVLTTKCTMRCESCNNLMQYFSPNNQYASSLEGLKTSLEMLLSKVSSIQRLRIIGGEPLLFKDLPQLMQYIQSKKQIKSFDILTNATIDFSDELIEVMRKLTKFRKVSISDYTKSPDLKIKLKQKEIIQKCDKAGIPWGFNTTDYWYDTGRIYKRNRNKKDIIANRKACDMGCVSLMSAEGIRANGQDAHKLAPKGAIFVCPVSSSLSRLRGLEEFKGDFINLQDGVKRFFDFYKQEFFLSCDYCQDWSKPRKNIPIAIQTKEVLQIKEPEEYAEKKYPCDDLRTEICIVCDK